MSNFWKYIELSNNWQDDFSKVKKYIKTAELIGGYPFVRVEYVPKWKENSDRKKDRIQSPIIREHLKQEN